MIETFSAIVAFLSAHWLDLLGALTIILTGLYTLFLVIPGDQPDKTIKSILDFTSKFSKK